MPDTVGISDEEVKLASQALKEHRQAKRQAKLQKWVKRAAQVKVDYSELSKGQRREFRAR